jgi:hypothetical protein
MENPVYPYTDEILKLLTQDYIDRIQLVKQGNIGIFSTLHKIAKDARLWELEIILIVAESSFVKPETIVGQLESTISRSSIYRKISQLVGDQIFCKTPEGLLYLSESYRSLGILGKVYQSLNNGHKNA